MRSKQVKSLHVGLLVIITVLHLAASARASNLYWQRDFNDGTTQGLTVTDMGQILYGIPTSFIPFQPTNVNKAFRMRFNLHPGLSGEDTGFAFDPMLLTDTSALMLIKFSTNPHFADATKDVQVGMLLRVDPLIATAPHYHGYLLALDDEGGLAIQKIFPDTSQPPLIVPNVSNLSCSGSTSITGWDSVTSPTHDWWMRGEVIDDGPDTVIIRARLWQDPGPEPAEWTMTCTDQGDASTGPPVASGAFGVAAKEKNASGQKPPPAGTWPADGSANYIDIDNLSAVIPLDLYCPTHCSDPVCKDHPDCQCNVPFADAAGTLGVGKGSGDGDVDMQDFALFQICYAGPGLALPADPVYCKCFDRPEPGFPKGDGDIDIDDFKAFTACASGPAIPWHATADCP